MGNVNKLTAAEAERLAMLAEECGEVVQVIGKILRHGYESFHPADPLVSNRMMLQNELADLAAVVQMLDNAQDIESDSDALDEALTRKMRYAHYQG